MWFLYLKLEKDLQSLITATIAMKAAVFVKTAFLASFVSSEGSLLSMGLILCISYLKGKSIKLITLRLKKV